MFVAGSHGGDDAARRRVGLDGADGLVARGVERLSDILEAVEAEPRKQGDRVVVHRTNAFENRPGLALAVLQRTLEVVDHGQPQRRDARPLRLRGRCELTLVALPQIVEIRETVREVTKVIEKQINPPLFGEFQAEYLLALGVPTEWLDAVRQISEDNFDALIGHLPDEAGR